MITDFTTEELDAEEWRPVLGFEGEFEVSNLGRVKRIYNGGLDGWRIMKASAHGSANSYLVVNLSREGARATGRRHKPGDYRPGTRKYCKVHILVLEAFLGKRPDGLQGCHEDSDSFNNRLSNLRWGTWESNCADMVKHGTRKGENNGRAKLDANDVVQLRQRVRKGYYRGMFRDLALEFGVHRRMISYAVTGKYWAHLTEEAPVLDFSEQKVA